MHKKPHNWAHKSGSSPGHQKGGLFGSKTQRPFCATFKHRQIRTTPSLDMVVSLTWYFHHTKETWTLPESKRKQQQNVDRKSFSVLHHHLQVKITCPLGIPKIPSMFPKLLTPLPSLHCSAPPPAQLRRTPTWPTQFRRGHTAEKRHDDSQTPRESTSHAKSVSQEKI